MRFVSAKVMRFSDFATFSALFDLFLAPQHRAKAPTTLTLTPFRPAKNPHTAPRYYKDSAAAMLIFGKVWRKFVGDIQAMPMGVIRFAEIIFYICGV